MTAAKSVSRWHGGMQCLVDQITLDQDYPHVVWVDVPARHCTDMDGCIAAVRRLDPDVREINVFAGGEPDVRYRKDSEGWTAWLIQWRVR